MEEVAHVKGEGGAITVWATQAPAPEAVEVLRSRVREHLDRFAAQMADLRAEYTLRRLEYLDADPSFFDSP